MENKPSVSLNPMHDNILLEEIPGASKIGTIIVPDAHVKKLNQGKVVDRGPLVSDLIKLDDIVFYPQHTEHNLAYGDRKFVIVSESNCLGFIRKN